MHPVPIRGSLPILALLLALAGCGGDGQRGPPSSGTVAYIVTSCRQTGGTMTLQQEARILRGEGQPVTVLSVGPLGPFPSIACGAYGSVRAFLYLQYGPLQRFAITPDGSGIVYELSDELVAAGRGLLPPEQRGIYYMRADGSGRRRLGPASRSPAAFGDLSSTGLFLDPTIAFDPSGQQFAYVDRGPDETGKDAAQVFVQGLAPGLAPDASPRQVTRLSALDFPGLFPENGWPLFVDARTIWFSRWTEASVASKGVAVDLDGTVRSEFSGVTLPGGHVFPVFQIVGGDWFAGRGAGDLVGSTEVWVADGVNLLQLTHFGRPDTVLFSPFYSPRDQRVYFTASADPFGTNPTENCQIFSIDPIGRALRQLTFFSESAVHATNGCFSGIRPQGCRIDFNFALGQRSQDPQTGTIYFKSSCNPLGQNPNGWQLFAMQPDGSDLRQLSNARGAVRAADGTIEVETVDAFWSAPY